MLLRASKDVLGACPGMRIVLGGDGDIDRYKALAKELGIADRCDFLGWVSGEDKERLFKEAGIYCLPSKNEAMPMSVMEAMAHGVPVITTNVGGIPQLIEDGVNGLLMDVDDIDRLSNLLLDLSLSPRRRAELGLAGRKKIESSFSVQSSINKLLDIYQDVFKEVYA